MVIKIMRALLVSSFLVYVESVTLILLAAFSTRVKLGAIASTYDLFGGVQKHIVVVCASHSELYLLVNTMYVQWITSDIDYITRSYLLTVVAS
jgi:hypothetical protein